MSPKMKRFAPMLAASLALSLAGCLSFGATPPDALLTLTPASPVAAGAGVVADAGRTLTVTVPSTPQEISTLRVPVRATPTTVAYVKEAQWVEPPARLFARLLSDTVTARTGRVVLGTDQSSLDPGTRLTGELRAFGIDAATSSAVVIYDAALARAPDRVEKRRFEARVPIAAIDAAYAGTGLNQAANQVATEVADWVGR